MKNYKKNLIILSLFVFVSCHSQQQETSFSQTDIQSTQKSFVPYKEILEKSSIKRKEILSDNKKTEDEFEQDQILQNCRDFLYDKLTDEIFPAWYGTEWHFQGIADKPKIGEFPYIEQSKVDTNRIACGYFVTRILSGLGFKIKVYKLAQQPSTLMIKNLTKDQIYSFNNEPIPKIKEKIREKGKGIYVVGLDCHVGFLVYDGDDYFRFVHSSYYDPPYCVVSDELDSFNPFAHSQNRVIGKLFDDEMLIKWINNEKIPIKYPYKP